MSESRRFSSSSGSQTFTVGVGNPATVFKRGLVYAKAISDCWNYGSSAASGGDCVIDLQTTVVLDELDIGAEIEVGHDAPNISSFNSPSSRDVIARKEQQKCEEHLKCSSDYENYSLLNSMDEQVQQQNLDNDIIELSNGKQKIMAGEKVGDGTMDEVYVAVKQSRRLLFKGVEIIRFRRGKKSRKDEYFKCSICPFKLPIPKLTRREAAATSELSAYMKMKLHIQNEHKKKPGCVKMRARPQYTCGYCEITFENLASLKNHNKTEAHPKFLTCDICGRPLKGGHFNLLIHKFSHKNDEERKRSIENNERGSYNAFQTSKLMSVYMQKKKEKNVRSSGKRGEAEFSPSPSSSTAASKKMKKKSVRITRKVGEARSSPSLSSSASKKKCEKFSRRDRNSKIATTPSATITSTLAKKGKASNGEIAIVKPCGCTTCKTCFSKKNKSRGRKEGKSGSQENEQNGVVGQNRKKGQRRMKGWKK